ncbi:hypothetical protein CBR_g16039 [Chara braunii]|uniref:Glycerophosphocholine acyltransferase 1 n=1 Tax=Chara braunii TaxID=69332 RepID=A0A388JSY7_CHABU|nr:hypothetical protein CBR_g16039 [Chara braunii]|eukprot:GBG60918.1 hypothetical protein CBR_g16039 [Chara braunii]
MDFDGDWIDKRDESGYGYGGSVEAGLESSLVIDKTKNALSRQADKTKQVLTNQAKKTKVVLSRQADKIVQSADKHETFINKVTYSVGVLAFGLFFFLLGARPQDIPYMYCMFFITVIPLRWVYYRSRKWHYFLLDFCYYANMIFMVMLLGYPQCEKLFMVSFAFAEGPLAWAIIVWRCSLVFSSLDKIISVLIHLLPGTVFFIMRWWEPLVSDDLRTETLGRHGAWPVIDEQSIWLWLFIVPLAVYCIWQALYLLIVEVMRKQRFLDDPEILTSYRQVATMALTVPIFKSYKLHCTFQFFKVAAAIWNGGSFLFEVMPKQVKAKEQKRAGGVVGQAAQATKPRDMKLQLLQKDATMTSDASRPVARRTPFGPINNSLLHRQVNLVVDVGSGAAAGDENRVQAALGGLPERTYSYDDEESPEAPCSAKADRERTVDPAAGKGGNYGGGDTDEQGGNDPPALRTSEECVDGSSTLGQEETLNAAPLQLQFHKTRNVEDTDGSSCIPGSCPTYRRKGSCTPATGPAAGVAAMTQSGPMACARLAMSRSSRFPVQDVESSEPEEQWCYDHAFLFWIWSPPSLRSYGVVFPCRRAQTAVRGGEAAGVKLC